MKDNWSLTQTLESFCLKKGLDGKSLPKRRGGGAQRAAAASRQLFLQGDIVLASLDRCPLGQTFSMLPSMTFDGMPKNERKIFNEKYFLNEDG